MKRLIIALFLIVLFSPVFAQNELEDRVYYYNFPVERIYPSSDGYVVQYRNSSIVDTIGIPNEWFTGAASKAEMVQLQAGADWPTMSVFYSNGEFVFVRLYVHRSKAHHTWGSIPQGTDLSRFFGDKESFDIKF